MEGNNWIEVACFFSKLQGTFKGQLANEQNPLRHLGVMMSLVTCVVIELESGKISPIKSAFTKKR